MEGYADRPALGERATELVTSAGRTERRLTSNFDITSYHELWTRVRAVAADWQHHQASPLAAGDRVCTLGFTSSDYATLELACIHLGAVSVPLQVSAALSQLRSIVAETRPRILASSVERLASTVDLALKYGDFLRRLIVFDHDPEIDDERETVEAAQARLAEAGSPVVLEPLSTVIERGRELPSAPPFVPAPGTDPLALIVYTSGSTGSPKGAMYPQRLLPQMWTPFGFDRADLPAVGIHYMPMSHLAGRWALTSTLARGGIGYFTARSDLSTLLDDITLTRPTELILVPRICDMLFERYQSELDRNPDETAVKTSLREDFLGGRIAQVLVGTAPLSPELRAFMESMLGMTISESYGSTESARILLNGRVWRPPVLDYRLADVPQMGYLRTDSPYPRGELLVKSETNIPGYYRQPEATAEMFDQDGYYRTGDIMAEIAPDRLIYLDRRNNVLKLSQGEFVAPSRLEALFVVSPLIQQIFVYGNSERAYLLAVVVPTEEALAEAGGDTTALKPLLAGSLRRVARDAELNPYEIPRDFLVETTAFSTGNGLLSDIGKLLRPRLRERYGQRLEQLYADQADGQLQQLHELRRTGAQRSVLDTVRRAAQALLGTTGTEVSPDAHFTDLGGDSLSALSFSTQLREIFHIELPVGVVISPANDLAKLAAHIESALSSGAERPTFATVHGAGSVQVRASDLTLDRFIDMPTLDAARALPRATGPVRTVLLTGSNGYLGRFLCLEWLERLAPVGGKLICVVRGGDAAAARQRLEVAFDSGDHELIGRFRQLAAQTLEVLAGDVSEPNLGLDPRTWQSLTETVDRVVHPAAHVNHVLPYGQLFGANVVGTAEAIRLAITGRIKPVTYVSSGAAAPPPERSGLDEDIDIRVLVPTYPLDDAYANGYGASKWASEVLLREAYDACGLPVATFRSDMILAHSRFSGQLNVPDQFTRLLLSLAATGIAPGSFYRGDPARAHYDGLPADFTAEAITTLGEQATDGYQSFNVINPHDDGISLDTFVNWLIAAGHPIERIPDYSDWFVRFEAAIRVLPDRQRQHSLLPLLHAFRQPEPARPGSVIPGERFRAAVRAAGIGADEDIPYVSVQLIGKYLTDLRQLGLL
ncbi:thioester reductase domain-containing protein [Micromonospora sp. STR1s_6]|uniref:Carboxylic acid reductase n=2 Tax=Micromonospora tarensis TaxID=2806100 RepID=A0ABS1YCB2_9ACTN|nr:thioester reductase domain-containing protein [Micromonospora tarensis]